MSLDKGIKAPSFNSIKTSLYKEINKKFPQDLLNLNEASENSLHYKALDEKDFVVYKDSRNFILQSPSLAKIQKELGDIAFCDTTFFISPTFAYQVFITRVYS